MDETKKWLIMIIIAGLTGNASNIVGARKDKWSASQHYEWAEKLNQELEERFDDVEDRCAVVELTCCGE